MPPLIDSTRYDDIRAALDISLDKSSLPDAIIELDIYLGEALRWIDAQTPVPPYTEENRTGDRAKNAAIFFAAALLAPVIPDVLSERQLTGEEYTRKSVNWAAVEVRCRARAMEQLALILDTVSADEVSDVRPQMFGVAHGYRGR
jgi:hypothetical protein